MANKKEHPRYHVLTVRVDERTAIALDKHTTINDISVSDYLRKLILKDLEACNG